MSDYLARLARAAHDVRVETLGAGARTAARLVVLDTLGAICAGSQLGENRRLAKLAAARSGRGVAALLGHVERAEPMLAALVNGTAGVALEVDEGNRWGGGHPAIHVLPAALATAEELGLGGRALIESVIAGYEVTSRLGGATRTRDNVHSHGTWGTAGAAVAVARLRGHGADDLRTVINLAVSMSPANSWTPCFEGATVRNLYPGRAGLQGVLAADALACGFTAPADAPSDVYGTILGDAFDAEAVEAGLGDGYRIERNYVKLHACCLYNHPALDAVHALRATERFAPEAVARIEVTSIPFVTRMADAAPATMLSAKFSVPWAVAAAVVLGRSDVDAFGPAALADARVRDLATRVTVQGHDGMSLRRPDGTTATVRITLTDGRVLTGATGVVRGDAANPVGWDVVTDKFYRLAAPTLGEGGAADVITLTERLDELKDVRDLTALLVPVR